MIIGILTDIETGGTFLSWSLYYLTGHDEYFCAKQNTVQSVTDNPVIKFNAHNFAPNQPRTLDEFESILDLVQNSNIGNIHTIYFHNFRNKLDTPNSVNDDTRKAVKKLQQIAKKIVVLSSSPKHMLYFSKYEGRNLHRKFDSETVFNKNFDEQHEDFINTFFFESKQEWDNLGLTRLWDRREFLALNLRPYSVLSMLPNIDLSLPHFRLDTFDLYNQFDKTILSMFKFLELDIDEARWDQWLEVYQQWRLIHVDRIAFVEYFDYIIDCIINNHYLDLSRFHLDLVQEATILHELLYKHNLTIKGYGLEKFPNNTQDLHQLLEKNTYHKIENIYGVL